MDEVSVEKNNRRINRMMLLSFVLMGMMSANVLYSLYEIDTKHHPYEAIFFNGLLVYSLVVIIVLFFEMLNMIISSNVKHILFYIMGLIILIMSFRLQLWLLDDLFGIIQRMNLINCLTGI